MRGWIAHIDLMEGERLTKRADMLRVKGRRKGRPRLWWEDCVKTDLVGLRGEWRTTARDMGVLTGGGDGSQNEGSSVHRGW